MRHAAAGGTKLGLGVLLLLGFLAAPAPAEEAPARGVSLFRLPNGLSLVVAVRPELRLAAVNLTVDLGSTDDPRGQSGMAHLLEHVSLSGSTRVGSLDPEAEAAALTELDRAFAARERERRKPEPEPGALIGLDRWFEQAQQTAKKTAETGEIVGGRLEEHGAIGVNATTTADATQFLSWIPAAELELWLSLEAERLQRPIFRRFYSEKNVVLREIAGLTGGNPRPQERFMEEIFPGSPQARPLAGDPDEIVGIDRPAALAYFRDHYRPEKIAIAVVGDVDPERVRRLCLRYFADWRPEGAGAPPASRSAGIAAARVRTFNSVRSPLVFIAYPRPATATAAAEGAALEALSEMINAEELSPLHRRLIRERSLAWSVGAAASYPTEKQTAVFLVHVYGVSGVQHEVLVRETSALLQGLREAPDEDVEGAILKAEMRLAAQLDDPPALASLLAFSQAVHQDWSVPFKRLEGLRRLKPQEVREAAGKLFTAPRAGAAGGS